MDQAFTYANRALAHTQWWPGHNIIAMANVNLAQILLAWNDLDGRLCAIQKAEEERKNQLMPPLSIVWLILTGVSMAEAG